MPRLPRLNILNNPHYVTQCGHNWQPCFFDDEDYESYLECLSKASHQYQCKIHSYLLLENNIQLLVSPMINGGISSLMQSIGRRYVQYVNHKYKRSGTLWGGRYKACVIDAQGYLLTMYQYIENEPVRKGIVSHPKDYPWSSYHYHVKGGLSNIITDHSIFEKLGKTQEERGVKYAEKLDFPINAFLLRYIKEIINSDIVLGGDNFVSEIEDLFDQRVRPLKRGRPKKEN